MLSNNVLGTKTVKTIVVAILITMLFALQSSIVYAEGNSYQYSNWDVPDWATGIPDFDPQGDIWMDSGLYEYCTQVGEPIPIGVIGTPTWNEALYPNAHVDYRVIEALSTPGAGSVNKHSGLVQATGEGTMTIFVYLVEGSTPQGNPANPCEWPPVDYMIVTVDVIGFTEGYGTQGLHQTIRMSDPEVTSFSGNNTNGWVNILNDGMPVSTENGIVNFTITHAFDIGPSFPDFLVSNAENVYVVDEFGDIVDGTMLGDSFALTLSASQGNPVFVYHLNTNLAGLASGNAYYLVFDPTYKEGDFYSLLGTQIAFGFTF